MKAGLISAEIPAVVQSAAVRLLADVGLFYVELASKELRLVNGGQLTAAETAWLHLARIQAGGVPGQALPVDELWKRSKQAEAAMDSVN